MKKKTIIVLSIITSVILLIGFCSYSCIYYIKNSVENMEIVLEDLDNGLKKQLTQEGMNTFPKFSADGNSIYYLSNTSKDSENRKMRLNILSLKDGKSSVLAEEKTGMRLTSSVSPEGKIVCYLEKNGKTDIFLFSTSDKSVYLLTSDGVKKSDAIFSPDYKWVSYISEDSDSKKKCVDSPVERRRKKENKCKQ